MSGGARSPRARRVRVATDEERALWRSVNRDTIPLSAPKITHHAQPNADKQPAPRSAPPPPIPAPNRRDFQPTPESPPALTQFTPRPSALDTLLDRTPGLDKRTSRALKRGQRDPEARIDLHGMTMDRAHSALNRFILQARQQGRRCVLVITGKGAAYRAGHDEFHDLMNRGGSLRRDVPRWLRLPPLDTAVVGVFQAHQRHGGDGALYVYLKKPRG